MLCTHCGNSIPEQSLTCQYCGSYVGKYANESPLRNTDYRAARQGQKPTKTLPPRNTETYAYGDYELSSLPVTNEHVHLRTKTIDYIPNRPAQPQQIRRGPVVAGSARKPQIVYSGGKRARVKEVNWMKVVVIIAILILLGVVGYYIYLSQSEVGRAITARKNVLAVTEEMFALADNTKDPLVKEAREELLEKWNEIPTQTYWKVGEEYLDTGDIETSIKAFRIADDVDGENYDGLLMLANAYEIAEEVERAEEIYLYLANEVSPFRTEAYTALIGIYEGQNRGPESAQIMALAYKNTEKETFKTQRNDLLPNIPEVDLPAGRHELEQVVTLTSTQGYPVYYTTDPEAKLPQQGNILQDGKMILKEGTLTLRAVAVNGNLVSDEMKVTYTIFYPRPPSPRSSLAPNTYSRRIDVYLKPGEEAIDLDKLHYYYTIDGSTPTTDSPEYTGEPITMPSGRVTLRAICVNQYGKVSNVLKVGYKFEEKPYLNKMYNREDVFSDFTINKTTQEEFYKKIGQPKKEIPTTYLNFTGDALHTEYDWGHAVFWFDGIRWILVRVDMNSTISQAPRGITYGMSEKEVVQVFKDVGQPPNKNETRGLYYEYPNVGQVLIDKYGQRYIHYSCPTLNNRVQSLDIYLQNKRVTRIVNHVTMK